MLLLIELMLGIKNHSAKICFIHHLKQSTTMFFNSQYQLSAVSDSGCLEGGVIHLWWTKFVLFIFVIYANCPNIFLFPENISKL